ncbi:MAG: hypothetical protein HC769_10195 [Cyanobacteria bacterium CRU_2_1]|nr:hypothetical protein [Cyanobacteria bacterium CRU_2_1]
MVYTHLRQFMVQPVSCLILSGVIVLSTALPCVAQSIIPETDSETVSEDVLPDVLPSILPSGISDDSSVDSVQLEEDYTLGPAIASTSIFLMSRNIPEKDEWLWMAQLICL